MTATHFTVEPFVQMQSPCLTTIYKASRYVLPAHALNVGADYIIHLLKYIHSKRRLPTSQIADPVQVCKTLVVELAPWLFLALGLSCVVTPGLPLLPYPANYSGH